MTWNTIVEEPDCRQDVELGLLRVKRVVIEGMTESCQAIASVGGQPPWVWCTSLIQQIMAAARPHRMPASSLRCALCWDEQAPRVWQSKQTKWRRSMVTNAELQLEDYQLEGWQQPVSPRPKPWRTRADPTQVDDGLVATLRGWISGRFSRSGTLDVDGSPLQVIRDRRGPPVDRAESAKRKGSGTRKVVTAPAMSEHHGDTRHLLTGGKSSAHPRSSCQLPKDSAR
jgi:hypothetical protein